MSTTVRRLSAAFGLLAFSASLLVPVFDPEHGGRSDLENSLGPSAHQIEHPVAHFGTDDGLGSAEHCALCHWARSLKHSDRSARFVVDQVASMSRAAWARGVIPARTHSTHVSVRGPPVLL
jgi:hypothetical protein